MNAIPRPAPGLRAHLLHRLSHLLRPSLLATLVLAGCGGGGDGGGATNTAATDVDSVATPVSVLTVAVADIKTLRLSWTDTPRETGYQLFVQADASSPRVSVVSLPANTTTHELQVFLPDQVNARYTLQACHASGCADVANATVEAALLHEAVGYFKGTYRTIQNGVSVDHMGRSVALSGDGTTLAVGAPHDDHVVDGGGAVHVFVRRPKGWTRQGVLGALGATAQSDFGEAVALSNDGNRLVVGDSGHDGARGAIHVFERSNGQWGGALFQDDPYAPVPPDASHAPRFGTFVAISGDGNTIVAGRKRDDATAVVIAQVNGQWVQQFAVPAHGPNDGSGYALSSDGNTLVVGRSGAFAATQTPGVVDVYTRVDNAWNAVPVQLTAANAGVGDRFGWSVAIAGDGKTIAVGAPYEDGDSTGIDGPGDTDTREASGAVYVFGLGGNAWTQRAYIKASNAGAQDGFGKAVALSDDGSVLAVTAHAEASGAPGLNADPGNDSMPYAGAAYVFRRQAGTWTQTAYVKATNPGSNDQFGSSVALSGDGLSLAVGAINESSAAISIGGDQTDNSALGSGAVYLY